MAKEKEKMEIGKDKEMEIEAKKKKAIEVSHKIMRYAKKLLNENGHIAYDADGNECVPDAIGIVKVTDSYYNITFLANCEGWMNLIKIVDGEVYLLDDHSIKFKENCIGANIQETITNYNNYVENYCKEKNIPVRFNIIDYVVIGDEKRPPAVVSPYKDLFE